MRSSGSRLARPLDRVDAMPMALNASRSENQAPTTNSVAIAAFYCYSKPVFMVPQRRTLEEQETIVRFDRTDAPAMLYTAAPNQAERWRKLGYDVSPLGAQGWQCVIPKTAVRFRKLVNGILPKRGGSGAGLAKARAAKSKALLNADSAIEGA